MAALYDAGRVHVLPQCCVVEPVSCPGNKNPGDSAVCLVIAADGSITPRARGEVAHTLKDAASPPVSTLGVLGCVDLLAGLHLVLITERTAVGSIGEHVVHRVDTVELFAVTHRDYMCSEEQLEDHAAMVSEIALTLGHGNVFVSYTLDITTCTQKRALAAKEGRGAGDPLWKHADSRFFWNGPLQQRLIAANAHPWVLPGIFGFVEIVTTEVNKHSVQYAVLSRRNHHRSGLRYHMRGIDTLGQVANNVETEQVVVCNGRTCALVQTRGSVPAFWKQVTGMKYRPIPSLDLGVLHTSHACTRHLLHHQQTYGKHLLLVNLVNQSGSERLLHSVYAENCQFHCTDKHVRHVGFDFHHECKGLRYDRVDVLAQSVQAEFDAIAFFVQEPDGSISRAQNGVVRTNCVDCLDRTNVVQTVFARRVLAQQLCLLGVLGEGEELSVDKQFEHRFKNVWANNGDALSKQYTTTSALKGDFTRTGKRRMQGMLQDVANSVARYIQNTFNDDNRQDIFALLTGEMQVHTSPRLPHPLLSAEEGEDVAKDVFVTTGFRVLPTGDKLPVTVEVEMKKGRGRDGNALVWTSREGLGQRLPVCFLQQVEKDDIDQRRVRLMFEGKCRASPLDFSLLSAREREVLVQSLYAAQILSGKEPVTDLPLKMLVSTYTEVGGSDEGFETGLWGLLRGLLAPAAHNDPVFDEAKWETDAEVDSKSFHHPELSSHPKNPMSPPPPRVPNKDGKAAGKAPQSPKQNPASAQPKKVTSPYDAPLESPTSRASVYSPFGIVVLGVDLSTRIVEHYHRCVAITKGTFFPLALHLYEDMCLLALVHRDVAAAVTNVKIASASLGDGVGAGIALSLRVQETPLCFLLVSLPNYDMDGAGYIGELVHRLTLGRNIDLLKQHHHVFVMGRTVVLRRAHVSAMLSNPSLEMLANDDGRRGAGGLGGETPPPSVVRVVVAEEQESDDDDEEDTDGESASGSGSRGRGSGAREKAARASPEAKKPQEQQGPAKVVRRGSRTQFSHHASHHFLHSFSHKGLNVHKLRLREVDSTKGFVGQAELQCQAPMLPTYVESLGMQPEQGRDGWYVDVQNARVTGLVSRKNNPAVYYSVQSEAMLLQRTSSVVRGGTNPRWPDVLRLQSLPMTLDFLKKSRLVVLVFASDPLQDDKLLGGGIITVTAKVASCNLNLRGRATGVFECLLNAVPLKHADVQPEIPTDLFLQGMELASSGLKTVGRFLGRLSPLAHRPLLSLSPAEKVPPEMEQAAERAKQRDGSRRQLLDQVDSYLMNDNPVLTDVGLASEGFVRHTPVALLNPGE